MGFEFEWYDFGRIPITEDSIKNSTPLHYARLMGFLEDRGIDIVDFAYSFTDDTPLRFISTDYTGMSPDIEDELHQIFQTLVQEFYKETGLSLEVLYMGNNRWTFCIDAYPAFEPTKALNAFMRENELPAKIIDPSDFYY